MNDYEQLKEDAIMFFTEVGSFRKSDVEYFLDKAFKLGQQQSTAFEDDGK